MKTIELKKILRAKIIFLFIAVFISVTSNAQVSSVTLKASGLTCSMSSKSIYKSLHALDFVLKIDAVIKTYSFDISFKPNRLLDFNIILSTCLNTYLPIFALWKTITVSVCMLIKVK